ncbi:epoxide hydrolase family protein [Nocardia sp. NBC_01009]|uniref:epoxide hydrolase family protein n=1 Tax=Nocardia sp. NBC_01009 TaxID=2975996 RepID=UPI00386DDB4D|nr:epoxide hydrolase [Nocardia sp. NBC_01009]
MPEIRPFRIEIPQADLDDLAQHLANTRSEAPFDELVGNADFELPVQLSWDYRGPRSYVQPLLEYWRDRFDWRAQEQRLNSFPQFTTEIDGQNIHFVHVRSPEPDATPLLLVHGWPSSFTEFLGLIDELTDPRTHGGDPAHAFHVVIPSYPGFAFSKPADRAGWHPVRVAAVFNGLMARLGYDRFGVHGNDGGAIVAPEMGRLAPDKVIGVHVDQIFSFAKGEPDELNGLSDFELKLMGFGQQFLKNAIHDSAWRAQRQAIGRARTDSPAALIAWSGQPTWSGQVLTDSMTPDELLTNISIYWFTSTAAPSARFSFETSDADAPTTVPIGLASFGYDFTPPRKFAERDHANIVQWNKYEIGGHWAAHEVPDLLLDDIRGFFAKVH